MGFLVQNLIRFHLRSVTGIGEEIQSDGSVQKFEEDAFIQERPDQGTEDQAGAVPTRRRRVKISGYFTFMTSEKKIVIRN